MSDRANTQEAPFPMELATLLERLRYQDGSGGRLYFQMSDVDRGQGCSGLTLTIVREGPDSYHPETPLRVRHLFPVPPAAYGRADWMRWLFDRISDLERHERMENFAITGPGRQDVPEEWERPYRPVHAPGYDPYVVHDPTTEAARETSFRGVYRDDGTGHTKAPE